MKNRIITMILILMLVLVLGTTAYSTGVPVVTSTTVENSTTLPLTMEDAQKLAIDNSYAISGIERKIGNTEELIEDQRSLQDSMENLLKLPLQYMPKDVTNNYVNTLMITKGYGVKGAQVQLLVLTNTLKQTEEAIKIGAATSYYNVLLAMKTVEMNNLTYNNAIEHLKTAQIKFDNGVITKLDLLKSEMAVNSAKTDLENSEDTLELKKLEFNNTLGLDFKQEVDFVSAVEKVDSLTIGIEEAVAQALENRPEIKNKKAEYELKEIETSAITAYYTSNLRQYKYAVADLEESNHNYLQSFRDIELNVRTKNLEVVKSTRALDNIDVTINLSREALRVTKLFYEYDLATLQDVMDAEVSLNKALIGKYQILVGYNISQLLYQNSINVGMPSVSSGY